MIQLLLAVIGSEMALISVILFKNPLRKVVTIALDRLKRGRGPVMAKTVAATVFAVLVSSLYGMVKIHKSVFDAGGGANPTDQVLMANHLLEASLLGCSLFLALMLDRLHQYIRELRRKSMEVVKMQTQGFDNGKTHSSDETEALEEQINGLKATLKLLESEHEMKTKEIVDVETNVVALRKQSEGFLLEYDRLHEENQNLQRQLTHSDVRGSVSVGSVVVVEDVGDYPWVR